MSDERKQNNKRIGIFLLITFLITYGVEFLIIRPMVGSTDVEQAMLAQTLIGAVMFVPAIGALITRLVTGDSITSGNLMLALNLRGNVKYYGFAWFGVAILIACGAVLYFLIYRAQFDPNLGYVQILLRAQNGTLTVSEAEARRTVISQILLGIFLAPIFNLLNSFGEEWGWRGYLLPKMLKNYKVIPTLLISGCIWGLWHMPLIVMGQNYGEGYYGYPFLGILAMCFFCMTTGVILSFVTIKTGSCIPAIIGHGVLNGFGGIGIYFTSIENPYNVFLGPTSAGLIGGAGFTVVAVFLSVNLYKDEKLKLADGRRKLL